MAAPAPPRRRRRARGADRPGGRTGKVDRRRARPSRTARSSTRGRRKSFDFGKLTKGKKLTKTVGRRRADNARRSTGRSPALGRQGRRPGVRDRARTSYASDVKRPGMLFGKVLRPPTLSATLASVNTRRGQGHRRRHRGPRRRFRRRRGADRCQAAEQRWPPSRPSGRRRQPICPSNDLFTYLKKRTRAGGGGRRLRRAARRTRGSIDGRA